MINKFDTTTNKVINIHKILNSKVNKKLNIILNKTINVNEKLIPKINKK